MNTSSSPKKSCRQVIWRRKGKEKEREHKTDLIVLIFRRRRLTYTCTNALQRNTHSCRRFCTTLLIDSVLVTSETRSNELAKVRRTETVS